MNNDVFINQLLPLVVKYGNNSNILPSVLMVNAILESAWGTSDLTGLCNNLYNLPIDDNWAGKCYSRGTRKIYKSKKDSDEYNLFKVYNSLEESVIDYTQYLTNSRRSKNGPLLYGNIIGVNSYEVALSNLYNDDDYPKRRNINYSSLTYYNTAIDIIEKYSLYNIDNNIENYLKEYNMSNKKSRMGVQQQSKPVKNEEVVEPELLYRVRLSWDNQESQILTTKDLDKAIAEAKSHPGYKVFSGDDGEIVFDQALDIKPNTGDLHLHPGKSIKLENCPLYANYTDTDPIIRVTGTVYMYNDHVNNGRIRVSKTNDVSKLNGKDITAILGCIDIINIR